MESVAPKFQGVAVELVSKNSGSLCTVPMLWAEMNAHKEECVNVLVESAKDALGGCPVKHLTYQDDDGDMCTLKAPTLSDAMTFIQEVQGQPGWGYLRITVEKVEEKAESQPAEPAEAAPEPASKPEEPTHSSCVNEAAVLGWLNCLGHSLDLRSLIPKLAEAALRIIDREAEEPALYGLLDVLMAFRDGHKTAEDIPSILPHVMEVLQNVPAERLVGLFALAQNEAKQIVAEFHKEKNKHANTEVHMNIICDGCNMSPLVGRRYKSLDRDDYDLCQMCFDREDRSGQNWTRVKSDLQGEVVGAFYATPCQAGGEGIIHHNVICDGCGQTPIIGKRFKAANMDYDLCGNCMAAPPAEAAAYHFDECIITAHTAAVPLQGAAPVEEAPEEKPEPAAPVCQDAATSLLQALDGNACKDALALLLGHSSESVRSAAQTALSEVFGRELVKCQEEEVKQEEAEKDEKDTTEGSEKETSEEVCLSPRSIATEVVDFEPAEPKVSASVVCSRPLALDAGMVEDESAKGDVSEEFADALASTGTHQAFRIARVFMQPAEGDAKVLAKIVVVNNGETRWPEASALTLAMGDGYGFPHMELGPLEVGEAAEISMDLTMSRSLTAPASRSTWAIIDTATGAPLGPLMLLEVCAAC